MSTIGEKISPILVECEEALWDHEVRELGPPGFTDEGFRAVVKLFAAATMDRMWRLQANEGMDIRTRADMAKAFGEATRQLLKTYTDIDTHELYPTPQP